MSRYKYTGVLLLLLTWGQAGLQGQVGLVLNAATIDISEDRIYIFSRGTRSKAYLLAHQFNIRDTNSTHVGIGFYQDHRFFIYNVIDEAPEGKSALVINSLDSFLLGEDVSSFSLWECANSVQDLALMKTLLRNYMNKKIAFDVQFKLAEDDSLYCSEFCAQVLNRLGGKKFDFHPITKPLNNPLLEAVLGRMNIYYYPVDFFQRSAFVRKVYEWRRKQGE